MTAARRRRPMNGWLLAAALLLGANCAAAPLAGEPMHLYAAAPGDTLIGLGRRFLVEPRRWPELAKVNALVNPNRIGNGTVLRIPLRLMHTEAVPATVLSVIGDVRGSAGAAQADQTLAEGGAIHTGADGHVTLRLVDGTVLRLRPDSRLELRESRRLRDAAAVRSGVRLEQGRVEVEAAPAPAGRPGFEIDTPQGVLGVRGTEFRVSADTAQRNTRGEVLGGVVVFSGEPGATGERVAAGFGTVISAAGKVATPAPLLAAPDVSSLPTLQQRILLRFALPPITGAAAYRGQISRNAAFDLVVGDLTSATPELRFAGLPDGDYVLRVRGVDGRGLEGRDTDLRFRLKARPEAPLPSAPAPRAVLFGGRVDFSWAANAEAQSYRLQLAADSSFAAPLRDVQDLRALTATLDGLAPGAYQWRVASVRGTDDLGPWGTLQAFELRPLPPAPKPAVVSDRAIGFSWEGLPGQRFELQVARDAGFRTVVFERQLAETSIELTLPLPAPAPATGRFFMRLRATDADGFVGPHTTPQYFDIPNCLRDRNAGCWRAGGKPLLLAP
jgi:hypothetical protein